MSTTSDNCGSEGCLRSLLLVALSIAIISLQLGCAVKSAYNGHEATDLSGLHQGLTPTDVASVVGPPENTEQTPQGSKTWHVYDRGFTGSLEEKGFVEKVVWAPIMAWGELVSLGLVEWMISCQTPCQKGLLEIEYDALGRVSNIREDFLPDNHPELKNCTTTAVRGDVAVCQGVREKVRPSSVPR